MQLDSIKRHKYTHESLADFEKSMAVCVNKYNRSLQLLRSELDTILIPVIVHVVHNGEAIGTGTNISSAQVYSQLDVLNEDYNRVQGSLGYNTNPVGAALLIKFVPATISPTGGVLTEPGIHRYFGGKDAWDEDDIEYTLKPETQYNPDKYMNIWTLKFGGSLIKTLGYAQLPSLSSLTGLASFNGEANTDGVVIRYNAFGRVGNLKSPYNRGRTTTHEVGHFFGLRHIWGDLYNCNGNDYCDDTPSTNGPVYGCPFSYASCTSGLEAMYQNYMDYTDDACMNIFTQNQKTRVMTVLQNSPRRKTLLYSDAYQPTSLPSANFNVSQYIVCNNTQVSFTDASKNNTGSGKWYIYNRQNQLIASAVSKNYNYLFADTGYYRVALKVSNNFGSDSVSKTDIIAIVPSTSLTLPFVENFESGSILGHWFYYNPEGDDPWQKVQGSSAYGIGNNSIYYNNYDSTYDHTGIINGIFSPKINMAANQNSYLEFDVAYAAYDDEYTDTLAVYYTTDCGQTLHELWKKYGSALATASPTTELFVPTSNEWRKEQISLSFLNAQSDVQLVLMNRSGWGNALYLDNLEIKVPVRSAAPVSNFIAAPGNVCGGDIITLSDQSTQYPTQWSWTISTTGMPAIVSDSQHPTLVLSIAGAYHISLTASNNLGAGTKITKNGIITVLPSPVISLASNKTIVACDEKYIITATGANYYTWYNERTNDLATNQHTSVFSDSSRFTTSYYVIGEGLNGCSSDATIGINVKDCITPIITDIAKSPVLIYPNPASKVLNLLLDPFIKPETIEIYNSIGIKQLEMSCTSAITSIDISHLSSGIFVVKAGNFIQKLMVE